MADKKITELTSITSVSGDDLLMVVNDPSGTPDSRKITVASFFAAIPSAAAFSAPVTVSANTTLSGGTVTISANTAFGGNVRLAKDTPSSNVASSEGYGSGSVWYDDNYIYVATASGTIKRAALSTF